MNGNDEIDDPKPDYSRPSYASHMEKLSFNKTGEMRVTERWEDRPTITWWGGVKHKLVRVF